MDDMKNDNKEGWGDFASMDRIDLLIILVAVAISTVLKYQHWHWFGDDIPNWVFNLALPFLLVVGAYKIRSAMRERVEQTQWAKRRPPAGGDDIESSVWQQAKKGEEENVEHKMDRDLQHDTETKAAIGLKRRDALTSWLIFVGIVVLGVLARHHHWFNR